MTKLPEGFELKGVYLWRNKDDPSSFFYLPMEAGPEEGFGGLPTLSLMVSDAGAILQMGTILAVKSEVLESLRGELSKKPPEIDPSRIRFIPAPISVEGVALQMGDGSGSFEDLKVEKSSGFPPYNTIFNVQLNAKQKAGAVAALEGNKGYLRVVYRILLPVQYRATTSISGEVMADLIALGKVASIEDASSRIESGISRGDLKMEISSDPGASDDLRRRTELLARKKAATLLQQMAESTAVPPDPDQARLNASISLNETVSLKMELSTDAGGWFHQGSGTDHIQVVGFTITEQKKESLKFEAKTVSLDFDPADLPIAFVEVDLLGEKAKLVGPGFEPVLISSGVAVDLIVKTSYTDGGPQFESRLPPPPAGWALKPKDLGLIEVVVDGSGLKQAGSKDARVRVIYHPSGSGTEDDRTVYLRGDVWKDSWYVVSRAPDLAGWLEFDWRETMADGSVVFHPSQRTDKLEFKLGKTL